ncbi:MAG TPA: IS200/IS605 family transposase [Bacteroidia bacterium]|jgi:REP element-mobilizing transposase RayT
MGVLFMANTYSRIYIQIVFAVQFRHNLIAEENRDELQKVMSGLLASKGVKLYAIYCMPDHVHILISMKPAHNLSDLVRDLKTSSSQFINMKRWVRGKFSWQSGFGAFSYSQSHIDNVVKYILNQKEHHQTRTFREEYVEFLEEFKVEYKEEYIFE